jgi:hypothetical protein
MRSIIGIDPGKTGGVAIIGCDGTAEAYPMPKHYKDRYELLCEYERPTAGYEVMAFLEHVHSIHDSSAKSNFTFGGEYYSWIAILEVMKIPFQTVTPTTWQKVMMEGKPKRPDTKEINGLISVAEFDAYPGGVPARLTKKKLEAEPPELKRLRRQKKDMLARHKKSIKHYAADTARRLFPRVSLLASDKCSVSHDGMVDALLIAEYGRRVSG